MPKEYIPGVVKGLEECMSNGALAGCVVLYCRRKPWRQAAAAAHGAAGVCPALDLPASAPQHSGCCESHTVATGLSHIETTPVSADSSAAGR